jgi:hypothetical protein
MAMYGNPRRMGDGLSGRRSSKAFRRRRKCALMSGDDAMDIDTAKSVDNEDETDSVYFRIKL